MPTETLIFCLILLSLNLFYFCPLITAYSSSFTISFPPLTYILWKGYKTFLEGNGKGADVLTTVADFMVGDVKRVTQGLQLMTTPSKALSNYRPSGAESLIITC
jgi:hypothetical protein